MSAGSISGVVGGSQRRLGEGCVREPTGGTGTTFACRCRGRDGPGGGVQPADGGAGGGGLGGVLLDAAQLGNRIGRLEQPAPGIMCWTTPAGRRYTTTPGSYP